MGEECLMRKNFVWSPIDDERVALSTPQKCEKCEDNFEDCMNKSWQENGKDPKEINNVSVLINLKPKVEDDAKIEQEPETPEEENDIV